MELDHDAQCLRGCQAVDQEAKRCASCDIDLEGEPLVVDGKPFCCQGCAQGGPCTCTYEDGRGRHHRNGHRDPLLALGLFEEGI